MSAAFHRYLLCLPLRRIT